MWPIVESMTMMNGKATTVTAEAIMILKVQDQKMELAPMVADILLGCDILLGRASSFWEAHVLWLQPMC